MDPRIRLIRDKRHLEGTAYFEFLPGPYSGAHWNDTSVYLDEEVFCMIECPFMESLPQFDHFAFTNVSAEEWRRVLTRLLEFRTQIAVAHSAPEITGLFLCLWQDTRESFAQDFNENRTDLIQLIDEFGQWVENTLSRERTIAILGM